MANLALGDLKDLESIEIPLEDGGVEIEFQTPKSGKLSKEHYANLADDLDDDFLSELANDVVEDFEADRTSRGEWEQLFTKGLKLLGLKIEQLQEPFPGACSAHHPILLENIVKFQSKAITELFPSGGPVKTQILGEANDKLEEQSSRVRNFMNWQLTEQMPEYFGQTEKLLFALALYGSAIKKNYYNKLFERPCNEYVPIDHFYVNNAATDLRTAERYTHVIYASQREYLQDVKSKLYRDVELEEPTSAPQPSVLKEAANRILGASAPDISGDMQYTFLEQHRYINMPGEDEDEPAAPYVVTVEKETRRVLQVRRCWRKEDKSKKRIEYFTHYEYVPAPFGFYGLGLVHLLGNLTLTITTVLRNLVDSGVFSNLQGGFKSKTARIVGGDRVIKPGEFIDVEFAGVLRDNIMPISYKEPSPALLAMYQDMVGAAQKFADSQEQVVADSSNYGPVGTTLALLDASTKFFSAIHKRCHRAQREEFRIIAELDAYWLPNEYPYDVVGGNRKVLRKDFDGRIDVIPVSDPNTPSQSQRLAKAQLVYQITAQEPPGSVDRREVLKYILKTAEVPNYEKILIDPEADVEPRDPMTDLKAAALGKPVRAFPGQDHDSYITIFGAFAQDPSIMTNATFAPALGIINAAIREHQLAKWLLQVEALTKMGMQQAPPGAMPEQIMAQAAQKVLQAAQMMAQQQQGGGADVMAAQAAMMDAQTRRVKVQADQIKAAGQTAVRNREVANREMQTQIAAAESRAKFMMDGTNSSIQHQKDLATSASDLLMKDALERDKMGHQQDMASMQGAQQNLQQSQDQQFQAGQSLFQEGQAQQQRAHEQKMGLVDKAHQSIESAVGRRHDRASQQADQMHQAGTMQMDQQHQQDMAEADRQHQAEQAAQERKAKIQVAKLKPKPAAKKPSSSKKP